MISVNSLPQLLIKLITSAHSEKKNVWNKEVKIDFLFKCYIFSSDANYDFNDYI